ncbi:MAG: ATP-dependent helicase HrpB [Pseudomonadota bacterium]
MTHPQLPIDDILADILHGLETVPNAIVIAPPGSGKSTGVAPALLEASWARQGQVILVQPRRVAVRTLASRLADLSGEALGGRIGYQMRDETRLSARTRLVVMTLGILRRRILADPSLTGVSAIVFDEFHERSIDADLCLAFARDVQTSLRSDLRLIIMSATLDRQSILPALPGFSVFEADGKAFPVETVYLPQAAQTRLREAIVNGVAQALNQAQSDILCFLPGAGEIRAAQRALEARFGDSDIAIMPLYGGLPFAEQKAVIAPHDGTLRRVILATDIAETSLTLPQVDAVVDAGLRRAPITDIALGLTQLKTVKAAKASLDQRRGRAGRTSPGVCYRLWAEEEMIARPAADAPELVTQDLTDFLLACADWGARNMEELSWVDRPPEASLAAARVRLSQLGLLDSNGTITAQGRLAVQFPLPADLAVFLLSNAGTEHAQLAAYLCALMGEDSRGLGTKEGDLEQSLNWIAVSKDKRAQRLRKRAQGWLKTIEDKAAAPAAAASLGAGLAQARPWLIAQARNGVDGGFKLASGRGAFVDPLSTLAKAAYLVVGDAVLSGTDVRIVTAWPLTKYDVESQLGSLTETSDDLRVAANGAAARTVTTKLGALTLARRQEKLAPGPMLAKLLCEHIIQRGLENLPWSDRFYHLQARSHFARRYDTTLPDISFAALLESVDVWLMPVLDNVPSVAALSGQDLEQAVSGMIAYTDRVTIDALAPKCMTLPTGHSAEIAYEEGQSPVAAAKLQAFFGLKIHPTVAEGKAALTLELLSPAGRTLQTTQDLPGFWRGSYAAVRKEMRGRYPKHPWPEDPLSAKATMSVKKRA